MKFVSRFIALSYISLCPLSAQELSSITSVYNYNLVGVENSRYPYLNILLDSDFPFDYLKLHSTAISQPLEYQQFQFQIGKFITLNQQPRLSFEVYSGFTSNWYLHSRIFYLGGVFNWHLNDILNFKILYNKDLNFVNIRNGLGISVYRAYDKNMLFLGMQSNTRFINREPIVFVGFHQDFGNFIMSSRINFFYNSPEFPRFSISVAKRLIRK